MKNNKDSLDGSFNPSKQLEKLDQIFAESLGQLGLDNEDDGHWEKVEETSAQETTSDIEEQFRALEQLKNSKQKKENKDSTAKVQKEEKPQKKETPPAKILDEEIISIPPEISEEEKAEQELVSKEEYDRLYDELYHVEPPKKREPNLFRTEFRFINAACCLLMIFGIFFYLLFAQRESGFINSENRMLAQMPTFSKDSYLDGSFAKDVTTFFTDTVPGREKIKRLSAKLTSLYGLQSSDKVSGTVKTVKKEIFDEKNVKITTVTANINIADEITKTEETSAEPDKPDDEKPKETKETTTTTKTTEKVKKVEVQDDGKVFGNVIVSGKGSNIRAVSAYYGTFDRAEEYAETINKWKKDLGKKVNVYNMPIPISSAFYLPKNFEDTVTSQKDNIAYMASKLEGVISVDAYSEIEKHTDEYIYSRTDHHWQPLGAYYAGKMFAEAAGINYPDLSEYGKYVKDEFCGTMYMYSDYNEDLAKNPDTFTYYKPKNDYTTYYYDTYFQNKTESTLFFDFAEGVNTYSVFLGQDEEICEIDTDVKNGRVLVLYKDSFGNALVPFFVGGFEKIYVCDFRYFNINAIDFLKEVGCTDLLFGMSTTSMATPSHITELNNIRIQ